MPVETVGSGFFLKFHEAECFSNHVLLAALVVIWLGHGGNYLKKKARPTSALYHPRQQGAQI